MNEEELKLYQAMGDYATDNLFWSLTYLTNALYHTPLKNEAKTKLMGLSRTYETIILSIYPKDEGQQLVSAMAQNNHLFIQFVDRLVIGSDQTGAAKQQWLENGRQLARLLCAMNPHWKAPEWTAMITHEIDLMDTVATGLAAQKCEVFGNTVPICKRLAIDMAQYMTVGIIKQGKIAR